MPRARRIRTSTTETVPGLDYEVGRRILTWSSGADVEEAVETLKDWASEHGYDAVVGIRLESVVDVSANIVGRVESNVYWVAYGTAIAFRPAAAAGPSPSSPAPAPPPPPTRA